MSECTHHWTMTSECPQCLRAEIDRLRAERDALREAAQLACDAYFMTGPKVILMINAMRDLRAVLGVRRQK